MTRRTHLTRGRIELGGVVLAIAVGGGIAMGATGLRPFTAAAAPNTVGYFDHGWEVDDVAPTAGGASRDHGWEVDDAPADAVPAPLAPSWDRGWEVDDGTAH